MTEGSSRGPQGTQIFSRDEVDRILAAAAVVAPQDAPACLRGASESVAGRIFPLESNRVVVGRGEDSDLVIAEPSISSQHARFMRDGDDWRVANLLSSNGTFVNGKRVSGAKLRHGDRVRIGRIEFVFELPRKRRKVSSGGDRNTTRALWWVAVLAAVVALGALAVTGWLLLN